MAGLPSWSADISLSPQKRLRGQRLKFKLEKNFFDFRPSQIQIIKFRYIFDSLRKYELNIYACIIYIINHIFYRTTKHIQILNDSKNESVVWSGLQTIIGLESHRDTTKIQGKLGGQSMDHGCPGQMIWRKLYSIKYAKYYYNILGEITVRLSEMNKVQLVIDNLSESNKDYLCDFGHVVQRSSQQYKSNLYKPYSYGRSAIAQ